MDGRPTWTDCDEAGDYVVPNVLSPRDLVFRPDNIDETVPHTLRLIFCIALGNSMILQAYWSIHTTIHSQKCSLIKIVIVIHSLCTCSQKMIDQIFLTLKKYVSRFYFL